MCAKSRDLGVLLKRDLRLASATTPSLPLWLRLQAFIPEATRGSGRKQRPGGMRNEREFWGRNGICRTPPPCALPLSSGPLNNNPSSTENGDKGQAEINFPSLIDKLPKDPCSLLIILLSTPSIPSYERGCIPRLPANSWNQLQTTPNPWRVWSFPTHEGVKCWCFQKGQMGTLIIWS